MARVLARAGTNMTLACPGLSPTSYVYLVEWKCAGCKCTGCPDPNGEGMRILRYNNELTRWDTANRDEVERRTLDIKNYGLKFGPVTAEDSGTYLCLINNRREPDALLQLTVEGSTTSKEKALGLQSIFRIQTLTPTKGNKNAQVAQVQVGSKALQRKFFLFVSARKKVCRLLYSWIRYCLLANFSI